MSKRYTQEQAAAMVAARGYVLVGEYRQRDIAVLMRCPVHNVEVPSYLSNIVKGSKMRCCGMVDRRATLSKKMTGAGNNFYGRTHSLLVRQKISEASKLQATLAPRGVAHPDYDHKKDAQKRVGVARPKQVSEKLRAHMIRRHQNFNFCKRKAELGKTAGKRGIFYVVRIGGQLKFGSATTTIAYRMTRMRQKHPDAELVLYCFVPDAGAYEAAMMERHREHWRHGEFFADFLGVAT